jgi:dGTP triphosphohydrolase
MERRNIISNLLPYSRRKKDMTMEEMRNEKRKDEYIAEYTNLNMDEYLNYKGNYQSFLILQELKKMIKENNSLVFTSDFGLTSIKEEKLFSFIDNEKNEIKLDQLHDIELESLIQDINIEINNRTYFETIENILEERKRDETFLENEIEEQDDIF